MILSKTPLRVSFIGGGTDLPEFFREHGGAVIATTIDKFIYHTVMPFHSRLFDYSLRIAYRKVECVASVDDIEHAPFREVLRHAGVERDVEISLTSDLPAFSGLGSSSSFTVGLLNALLAWQGKAVPHLELAYQAIRIERDVLREAVGCQDQVLAAVGGFNLVEFFDTDRIVVHRIPLSARRMKELNDHLMLFYTGIRRKAGDIEKEKITRLAHIGQDLRQMRSLVDEGYALLTGNNGLEGFGLLLHRAWQLKRGLHSCVSNDQIDRMYAAALEAGALGGKLLGAGGGGFLLLFAPPPRQAAIRQRLANFYEIPFTINTPGSQIVHA